MPTAIGTSRPSARRAVISPGSPPAAMSWFCRAASVARLAISGLNGMNSPKGTGTCLA